MRALLSKNVLIFMQIKNISPVWIYTSQFTPIFAPLSLSDALCLFGSLLRDPTSKKVFLRCSFFPLCLPACRTTCQINLCSSKITFSVVFSYRNRLQNFLRSQERGTDKKQLPWNTWSFPMKHLVQGSGLSCDMLKGDRSPLQRSTWPAGSCDKLLSLQHIKWMQIGRRGH